MTVIERVSAAQRREHDHLANQCRADRHWMEAQLAPPPDWNPPPGSYWWVADNVIHKLCYRCGTWRHIAIDYLGNLLASTYDYPDWYRRQGEGKPTAEDLRLWQIADLKRKKR